jgi:hypothetical protein
MAWPSRGEGAPPGECRELILDALRGMAVQTLRSPPAFSLGIRWYVPLRMLRPAVRVQFWKLGIEFGFVPAPLTAEQHHQKVIDRLSGPTREVDDGRISQKLVDKFPDSDVESAPKKNKDSWGIRRRLPDERDALVHSFVLGDMEGTVTVGLYDDGMPGEIFLHLDKMGETMQGWANAFGIAFSTALQFGAPLDLLTKRLELVRFKPDGWSKHPDVRYARSVVDYLMRWLRCEYLSEPVASEAASAPEG